MWLGLYLHAQTLASPLAVKKKTSQSLWTVLPAPAFPTLVTAPKPRTSQPMPSVAPQHPAPLGHSPW